MVSPTTAWNVLRQPRTHQRWVFSDRELSQFSAPHVGTDGMVYGGNFNHRAYALGPDGVMRWRLTTKSHVEGSPQPSWDGSRIYTNSRDLHLYITDAASGQTVNRIEVGALFEPPAAGPAGRAYVATLRGIVACDDTVDHALWKFNDTSDEQAFMARPTVGADGTVYAASMDGRVYALAADGRMKWRFPQTEKGVGGIFSSPALSADGSTVFQGSFDHKLYAIDAGSGVARWTHDSGASIECTPLLTDGLVIFGNKERQLIAVDASSGARRWQQAWNGVVPAPVAGADGTLLLPDDSPAVVALDTATGQERYRVPLEGPARGSVALSPDLGTVYCASDKTNQLIALRNEPPEQALLHRVEEVAAAPAPTIEPGTDALVINGVRVPVRPRV